MQQGPISSDELKQQRGTPQSIQQTPEGQSIYQYSDSREVFQVNQNGQVTYYYRNPTRQEEFLQYWLNRWKDTKYHFTEVIGDGRRGTDISGSLYYINYDNNERFVYDQAIRRVIRVIYELETADEETPGEDNIKKGQ